MFKKGEQLAKATGIVVLVEKELDKILDTQVVEVQWSNGTGQVRYYAESLMLIAAANPNV